VNSPDFLPPPPSSLPSPSLLYFVSLLPHIV